MAVNKLKLMASALLALAGWLTPFAQEKVTLSNVSESTPTSEWGTSRAETYDLAVYLNPQLFDTYQISGFSFLMQTTGNMSGCSGWASKELRLESKVNVPDIKAENVSAADSRISVVLPSPVSVGPEGLYIGVSFTMDSKETPEEKKPVVVISDNSYGLGMYVHSSRSYSKWTDINSQIGVVPAVNIDFVNVPEAAATITVPAEIDAVSGEPIRFNAMLSNRGSAKVASMKIAYTVDGSAFTAVSEIADPVADSFMTNLPVELTLPAIDRKGHAKITLAVSEINGKANILADSVASSDLFLISSRPVHRPLLEEYTGLGCGYCPRGEIGISKMEQLHEEDFVAVAYHVGDVMSIMPEADYPNPAPAQPVAWLSRSESTDPYFGNLPIKDKTFGFDKVWQTQADKIAHARLDLNCEWTDENKETISVTSDFSFVRDYAGADFRMVYMLVADGLGGEGSQWLQGNYYSGEAGEWPEDFNWLVESPQYIAGLKFNNVLIYTPAVKGIPGSIPADIVADQELSHTTSINIADAVNLDGLSLVQDKQNLRIVAAIVDAADGHVVNSAKAVPVFLSAESIAADTRIPAEVKYLNLQGQPVASSQTGIVIRMTIYTDGSVSAEKIYVAE